jgi:sec-independent protein translocase protein TatC
LSEKEENLREMGFLDHLLELRSTIIWILSVWIGSSMLLWFFSRHLLDFLLSTIPVESLYFNAPIEAFMVRLKLSFITGALITFPFALFKLWAFISPGLFSREKRIIIPMIAPSAILFYTGAMFAYWVMVPIVLGFLLRFGTDMLEPLISVSKYFEFVARLCFTFGVVFQLPLAIIFLTWIGVVSPKALLSKWRYAIVIIFIAGALLTPPDPASQLLMAIPLVVLFMGSVLLSLIFEKRRKAREEERDTEEEGEEE